MVRLSRWLFRNYEGSTSYRVMMTIFELINLSEANTSGMYVETLYLETIYI